MSKADQPVLLNASRQIRFRSDLRMELQEQADIEGRTFSAIVRDACQRYLDESPPQHPAQ